MCLCVFVAQTHQVVVAYRYRLEKESGAALFPLVRMHHLPPKAHA